MPFTNDEKLQAVKRELGYRRRVYENRVRDKKMTQEHATHQIKLFEEIEADYEARAAGERLL
jgi:hypothetical protein